MNDHAPEPRSIAEAHYLLCRRKISPSELLEESLTRLTRLEPHVHAWVACDIESARRQAVALDARLSRAQDLPPLFAIPYGVKDIFHTRDFPTEAGSRVLQGFRSEEDATAVERLAAQDAILIGKTTTTEFANWGTPPPTVNPWRDGHTPGGSSSGSAAAVAAGMVMTALGTQTAGSLSRPAAYNGLTVLKASYGRISKAGVIPASWSLDHVGAFTRSVEDSLLVYQALAGPDPRDETTWTLPAQSLSLKGEIAGQTIGWLRHPHFATNDGDVVAALDDARRTLETLGIRCIDIAPPPGFEDAVAAQQIIMQAETTNFHADRYYQHPHRYGDYLQAFISEGLTISANDYLRAQRIRQQYRQAFASLYDKVDLLMTPAAPTTAPLGLHATGSPAFNLPFTNLGVPTLVLPVGLSADTRLPVGMQLIAPNLEEQRLIHVGHRYQQETDWHRRWAPNVI